MFQRGTTVGPTLGLGTSTGQTLGLGLGTSVAGNQPAAGLSLGGSLGAGSTAGGTGLFAISQVKTWSLD